MSNREFKFRIWDKLEKKWSTLAPHIHYFENGNCFEFEGSKYQRDNFIIQQFTGLKDAEGKEIYEGDIVRVTSEKYPKQVYIAEVKFDTLWGVVLIEDNGDCMGGIDGKDMEVIGNIFENYETN